VKDFAIDSQLPYQAEGPFPGRAEALHLVLEWMDKQDRHVIHGDTGIFIYPAYKFRICTGLITNFHQPKSTLIMLIAAFIGEDWRKLYQEALEKDYRFLSYGDSCLLLP
jgi:S-adenosylmethionine:tRNA ribosyltransferase-isomerase